MMMYKIKQRKRFKCFVETMLKIMWLSLFIFGIGYALQFGLHEHLVETLTAILVLTFFIIIFVPKNKY